MEARDQHFLAHHYGWAAAARLLAGGKSSAGGGGGGPGRAWFDSDSTGISYSMPGEPHAARRFAHRLSLATVRAHMAAQPAGRVAELQEAVRDHSVEYSRWWQAMTAISRDWYSDPDATQRAALKAEESAHLQIADRMSSRIHVAVLAVLPLHDGNPGEPADLIQWAESLAITHTGPLSERAGDLPPSRRGGPELGPGR